jgi:signal transduction histidine kinase
MRIQTRLFLATGALVLALMAVQWWLHQRQLEALKSELSAVATAVGRDMLSGAPKLLVSHVADSGSGVAWVDDGSSTGADGTRVLDHEVQVMVIPEDADAEITRRWTRRSVAEPDAGDRMEMRVETEVTADRLELHTSGDPALLNGHLIRTNGDQTAERRFLIKVETTDDTADRVLVIEGDRGEEQRIPIPVQPAVRSYRTTLQRGAVFSGVLLAVGLVGAAVLANRVSRPLRGLAAGAEFVAHGDLGYQVPVDATGEVGELQRSFNAMSSRLAELEAERDRWREREHLAQLGDVSRGLAHTLRNPLNTLGLAVEELASDGGRRADLVATSRAQIGRIDRWLRSFLALGASDAAEPSDEDLADLTRAVVFEAVQQGRRIEVGGCDEPIPVSAVGGAVQAALANLLDNAADVSPADRPVKVDVGRDAETGWVSIRDRGPGLPDEVRRRLYEPHVTTKTAGSGMGLYLARQLVVGMHGGALTIEDHPGGGTIAVVKLPLSRSGDGPDA